MYFCEGSPITGVTLFAILAITIPVIILAIVAFTIRIVKVCRKARENKNDKSFSYAEYFGGDSNIEKIDVVMSRVNVTVKDLDLVKMDDLKAMKMGVLVVGNTVKCASQEFADKVAKKIK